MNLFDTRQPVQTSWRGETVLLPDGVADESDDLFSMEGGESRAWLSANGLLGHRHPNSLAHVGGMNLLTQQASFQLKFDIGNGDLSPILGAWEKLKPMLRRSPIDWQWAPRIVKEGHRFKIHEPGLSRFISYAAIFVEGEGWFRQNGTDVPRPLSTDDATAFEMLRQRFGWPGNAPTVVVPSGPYNA
jgi:hypothetical protein